MDSSDPSLVYTGMRILLVIVALLVLQYYWAKWLARRLRRPFMAVFLSMLLFPGSALPLTVVALA
jgi:hypothetical protein